ncbi:hypothetical protein ACS0TY_013262 [Phlomoides rotata]
MWTMSGRRQKHTQKRILPESFLREDDVSIMNMFLYEPLFSVGVNVFLMVYEPISGICWVGFCMYELCVAFHWVGFGFCIHFFVSNMWTMSGRRQKHTRKRILPESFLREDDVRSDLFTEVRKIVGLWTDLLIYTLIYTLKRRFGLYFLVYLCVQV